MCKDLDLIPIEKWNIFDSNKAPLAIVGPCSAESREQILNVAKDLKLRSFSVFRAGLWKPRTYPGSFEGLGEKALPWLQEVQELYGLKVCTEVAGPKHIELCLKAGLDMLWIGARTTANPFMMQEIADCLAGVDIPILVKNPVNQELGLWIGAFQRLNRAGIKKLAGIHRGFSTLDKIIYRNNPAWAVALELKSFCPQLPIFADPSHIAGKRKYLKSLSQRALDLGLEGLMLEVHPCPDEALSDAAQQLSPAQLSQLIDSLQLKRKSSEANLHSEEIATLRERIDVIDENILDNLSKRLSITAQIGSYKKQNNMAVLQVDRWDKLMESLLSKADSYNIDRNFIKRIFNLIHEASLRQQNEILEVDEKE